MLEKCALTPVMSLSCWRAITYPEINRSPTTLKSFDVCGLQPYGLLPSLLVELKEKSVSIHVEFFDAPLHCNIILGRNFFYAMHAVALSVFCVVWFLFQGNIVIVNQLEFCSPYTSYNSTNNVPLLASLALLYQNVGVGLLKYSSLMLIFLLKNHPPSLQVAHVNIVSSTIHETSTKGKSIFYSTPLSHFEDITKLSNPPRTPPLMIIFWQYPTLTTYHIGYIPPDLYIIFCNLFHQMNPSWKSCI